jgi:chromosome segregation ATPase
MPDENTSPTTAPLDAPVEASPSTPPSDEIKEVSQLPSWAQDEIRKLRKEAADRRGELKRTEQERQQQELERLAKQQEWEQLAKKFGAELETIKPRAERLDTIEDYINQSLQKRIDSIPASHRSLVPKYDDPLKTLEWLDANAQLLTAPRAPELDAGARGDSIKLPQLTEQEREYARLGGMTDQQYAEMKLRGQKARGLS